ncbi:NAD-dependent epimerase/dehydratase family protein [Gemmatimonadota bacterium]
MTVLITGAAGFIASHLTELLLHDGHEIVGLDNFDDFYDPAVKEANLRTARDHQGFRLVRGDIRDPDVLTALPEEVDTVIHIAARAGVRPSLADPLLYFDVNVTGTLRLLELARERGIRNFLFASSSSVYGESPTVPFSEADRVDNPISPYAATKRAGELLCHTYNHLHGTTCLCLRFFTVYGPRQRPDLAIHKFARLLDRGEEIPLFGTGDSERDYTYVEDIVKGVREALRWTEENPEAYEIVNLGGSSPVGLRDMIGILGREMGVEPMIRQHPMQPGDVSRTYADIDKARRFLNYDPKWGFEDGIRQFVDWYRAQ